MMMVMVSIAFQWATWPTFDGTSTAKSFASKILARSVSGWDSSLNIFHQLNNLQLST
jgi:hypothetical protein